MRTVRLFLVALAISLPWFGAMQSTGLINAPIALAAAPADAPAQGGPNIDVKVNEHVIWFSNPVLLAAGAVGVLLVIVLVAMAARGGGTTIIREK